MLSCGQLLDSRYRLDERIATGGMGDVWRGTDVLLGRTVAVKVLRAAMLSDPEFAARFYGEARMLAAFRHPGVVEVYDYNSASAASEDRCAYLVMAYVAGEPLANRIKGGQRLGVAETMSIVAQAADALHAAHENGIVHRDVKPGNLMVKPNGTVILVDFGVARSVAVTSVTGVNSIVGTALYMAPEQVSKGDLSPATDIYALGAVAYQCLAGRPPFDGDNALQVALCHLEEEPPPLPDDVPAPVRELIARAMAKNPADRFRSAAAFADASLAAGETGGWPETVAGGTALIPAPRTATLPAAAPVRPPAAVPPAAPPRRRRRALLLALVGASLLAGGTLIAVAADWEERSTPVPPAATTPAPAPSAAPESVEASPESQPPARPSRAAPAPPRTGSPAPVAPPPSKPTPTAASGTPSGAPSSPQPTASGASPRPTQSPAGGAPPGGSENGTVGQGGAQQPAP